MIIYPKFFKASDKDQGDGNDVAVDEELIQSFLALVVISGLLWSYLSKNIRKLALIKYLLYIQSIQMIMSNLHRYRSKAKA